MTPGARRCQSISRSALVLLALWLSAALACGGGRPAATFGSGLSAVPAAPGVQAEERSMHRRLNRDRAAQGLGPLAYDERLADVARFHSADMRDSGFFDHYSPHSGGADDRLDAAGYAFLTVRENLSEAPDVESSQDGLLASPPHHENIMASDVTHVGIGIVRGGVVDPNNLTVTQVFATPGRSETADLAKKRVAERISRERRARGLPPAKESARLSRIAGRHLEGLGPGTSPEASPDLDRELQAAMGELRLGGIVVSGQVVGDSSRALLPGPLGEARDCSFGLAVRRAAGERGRPSLQLILLVGEPAAKR